MKPGQADESGQTLIETIVAIFILTTALTTALGMTLYAFSTLNLSANEIVASNLAREGIDVIRMMRDTNWLAGDATGGSYALQSCPDISGDECYPEVLNGPSYNLSIPRSYALIYHDTLNTWSIISGNTSYYLQLQPDGSYTSSVSPTQFARKIVLSQNSASPYTAQNPELIVQSIVGWSGKTCVPMTNGGDPATTNCKITVEEHLTNWKDYQ